MMHNYLRYAEAEVKHDLSDLQSANLHHAGMDDKHSRLKLARQLRHKTATAAAEAIGVPYGTYSGHESGTRGFDEEDAKRYGKAYRVRPEWILLGEGPMEPGRKSIVDSFAPEDDERRATGDDRPDLQPGIAHDVGATVIVPRGGVVEIDIEAGLGGGGLATETYVRTPDGNQFPADAVRGVWQLPEHVFTQMRSRSQNVRCFPVQGDSMLDTLDEGDFVFVDVAHRVPSPPGIYALDDGFGGVIVKRLEVVDEEDGEPIVRVISDNDRYAERRERADSLRIVGRYVAMFTMRNRR